LDAFGHTFGRDVRVLSTRGVNGIDGTLSSALGVCAASGRPTVLLSGDLAFLHDLNGLLIAKRYQLPLTVVVVNNDGGGIFSFLPIAQFPDHFEELFGTPHGVDLSHAAALFGAGYMAPRSPRELVRALGASVGQGFSIVAVRVDRQSNPAEHQSLYGQVQAALGGRPWRES
jgi:2-succinyl-5-enolpyruvyl-6-hydroxy-3-cyclohexene-1-carboxylate synthase